MRLFLRSCLVITSLAATSLLLSACTPPVQLQEPLPDRSNMVVISHLGDPRLVLYTPDPDAGFFRSLLPAHNNEGEVVQFSQPLPIVHLDYTLNTMTMEQLRQGGYVVNFIQPDTEVNKKYIKAIAKNTDISYAVVIKPYTQDLPQNPKYYDFNTISGFGMIYNYREGKVYYYAAYKVTIWDAKHLEKLAEANYLQSQVSRCPANPLYWPKNYAQVPYTQVTGFNNWLNRTVAPTILAQIENMMAQGSISS